MLVSACVLVVEPAEADAMAPAVLSAVPASFDPLQADAAVSIRARAQIRRTSLKFEIM